MAFFSISTEYLIPNTYAEVRLTMINGISFGSCAISLITHSLNSEHLISGRFFILTSNNVGHDVYVKVNIPKFGSGNASCTAVATDDA